MFGRLRKNLQRPVEVMMAVVVTNLFLRKKECHYSKDLGFTTSSNL